MRSSSIILALNDASIGFHKRKQETLLLEKLNISVREGELTGVIGRNGAGKSTLLRSVVRLQNLLSGTITLKGSELHSIDSIEFSRTLAYVSSGLSFAETMTVGELVSLGRFPYTNWIGTLQAEDIALINEAMVQVGIMHLSDRKLIEISDGERQKAMIARTLAQNTSIIILDEPTAFLDLPSKYDIISLLYELTRKGKTVIYSTHDLNIALRFSDKIWLIDNKIIHEGSPEDLILNKTITSIFESDRVLLNEMTGDFELRRNYNKKICLKCENPVLAYWTKQALQRSGYEMVEHSNDLPVISADMGNNIIIWKIQRSDKNLQFESIYDLLSIL